MNDLRNIHHTKKPTVVGWQLYDELPVAPSTTVDNPSRSGIVFDSLIENLKQDLLDANHARVQREIAAKLGEHGEQAIDALIDVIRDGEEGAQVLAAYTLRSMGSSATPQLVNAVLCDAPVVRQKAIWVLYSIGGQQAVAPLIEALHDTYAKTRRYAAWALGYLKAVEAISYLVAAMDDVHDKVRFDAGVALVKIGGVAADALLETVYTGSVRARKQAVVALMWLKDERALAALIHALHDPDPNVRVQAAFALGWIADKDAVEPLLDALYDQSAEVRMQAAAALGWIGDARALDDLVGMFYDEDDWVSYSAVEALTNLGDVRAVAPLLAASRGSVFRVREAASAALNQLGYPLPN
ncbi:MAG: HEAT repeat domain-containing protein [Anaerolineae bacterium]